MLTRAMPATQGSSGWEGALSLFFFWIAIEDQVRKALDNPLSVYFVKDALLVFLLALCLRRRSGHRRSILPRTMAATLLWGLLLHVLGSFNPLLLNPLTAAVGIKLTFTYVPFLYVGYRFAEERGNLRAVFQTILVTGVIVGLAGIHQALVDPTFLNPEPTGGLEGTQLRMAREGVEYVTSTFLAPGRYAMYLMNVVAVAMFLYLVETRRSGKAMILVALGVLALALATSGARLGVIALAFMVPGTALVVRAGTRDRPPARARVSVRPILGLLFFVATVLAVSAMLVAPIGDALSYYWDSLFSRGGQGLVERLEYHVVAAGEADLATWVFGRGTGSASFGIGYLPDAPEVMTEGGYAAILWELGLPGLLFYILLAAEVSLVFWRPIRAAPPSTTLGAVVAAFGPLTLFELWYVNILGPILQQYVVAVFLWFLTGVCLGLARQAPGTESHSPEARAGPVLAGALDADGRG